MAGSGRALPDPAGVWSQRRVVYMCKTSPMGSSVPSGFFRMPGAVLKRSVGPRLLSWILSSAACRSGCPVTACSQLSARSWLHLMTRLSLTSSGEVPWPGMSTSWAVGLTGNLIS